MSSSHKNGWKILAAAAAVSLVLVTGCTKKSPAASTSGAASGPRGKIVIYTSMYEDIIEAMDAALTKQFPDCDIEFFYGGTGTLQAKIAAEKDSGKLGCDMLMVAEPAYSLELKENNMLHAYKSPEAALLDFDYDPEGYWYPVRVCNMVLAYNPEKYSKDSIPNSLYDFAYNTGVKGAISMSNPLTSGTAMAAVTALKDKYGYEYFTALGSQNVMVESGSVALTKLETGECQVIMILEESVLKKRQEENSRLEVIYPTDGTIIIPSTIMTVSEQWSANKNTAAAQAVTDWFLSEAGQANIVAGWMHSARADYPAPPYDAIATSQIKANNMPVNWENCYRQREEIRTKFEEAVTRKR
ncbi:MAG: ABC transporter substrate-binding protein [Treponema sp.]|jgi:iron(III) transport system substrate-binding protein|nr:ABC transporter substrate-binding protein [Treponema sp.]